jgi:hypothetical protein
MSGYAVARLQDLVRLDCTYADLTLALNNCILFYGSRWLTKHFPKYHVKLR